MAKRILFLAAVLTLFFAGSPAHAQNDPVTCPGDPVSRLVIRQMGQVTPGDSNYIRSRPGGSAILNSKAMGQMPPGGVFIVLDGPDCVAGYAWWQVNYRGMVGWTAEGVGTTYWLAPAGQCTATLGDPLDIYQDPINSVILGVAPAKQVITITTRTTIGWLGFDPGTAPADKTGLARLNWFSPIERRYMKLNSACLGLQTIKYPVQIKMP